MTTTTFSSHDSSFLKGIDRNSACKEVSLARNRMLALPANVARVVCLSGELWLTCEGDSKDYILPAGRSYTLGGSVRPAVQALADSTVRLVSA